MAKTKEYQLDDVTVVWEPSLCIHSKKCVHGLPKVFKPTEKPWVQTENTTTEALKETIDTCPSGALRYYVK
ncbi:(4Fe-4S)-binding protein [Patiriisocius hiemis]|uniref:(4Fe-4S)-binding protein n=1 Tax=Patiriisocius hiemis TaxID=3075604 RepID=A0ABU2YFJ8_9FLAO|nr:(4Fe-4S)-binding protein [Constantimarinum sp. W242]MDT0556560.1 (4Fe-4S)-binding protein [Constantimarinum sp. W242]